MVRRCCVLTCRNSRSDCDERRVSFFKVPSEQRLFEKWVMVIAEKTGGEVYKTSSICERHFREDEVKREALLRDSFGNVIFQRPLIKCSLVKEAIPSIFEKDLDDQTIAKKKRKRRSVIPNYPEGLNNTGNFTIDSDGNLSINYSPILVTFNDNQNNALQFNVTTNNSESTLVPAISKSTDQNYENIGNNINGILNAANYYVNGHVNTYSNSFDNMSHIRSDQEKYEGTLEVGDQDKTITIYINKPTQEINESNVNNIENTKTSETLQSTGTSVIQKEQVSQRIPSQFNNISELSLAPPKEVTIIVPNDEIIVLNESNNYAFNNDNTQKTMQPNKGTIHYPLPESNIQMNIRSFDLIFHNSHKIKLPNAMWGYHKNSIDKDIIIFSKAKWFKSNVLIPPIYEKQVIFHESDNIKIYINNKFSPVEVRRPRDISEMEQILQGVDETVVCSGGPSIGDCDTAQCAQKDYAVNRWRHKLCPIIVTADETTCKFCVTINQVLRYPKKKKLPFGRRPRPEKQQKEEAS